MNRLKKLAGIVNESKIVDTQNLESKIKRIKSKQPTGEYRGMRDMPKIRELFTEMVSGIKLVGFGVEDITQLLEDIVRLEGVPTNDRKYKLYQFKMKGVRLNLERIVDALESYIEDNYSEKNP